MHHLKTNSDTLASYKITLDNNGNFKSLYQKEPLTNLPLPIGETTTFYKRFNVIDKVGAMQMDVNMDGNVAKRGAAIATYDLADNLTQYINGTVNYSAKYDGLGIRREATRNGITTRFIKDITGSLDNVLAETDGNNAINYYYIQGLGMLARISPNGTIQYYQHNLQGSTIAVTDANKNVTHSYAYNEWGALTNKQEQNENLYRFMGKYGITYEDSCLYYVRARYYDPLIGRFYSQDPVWDLNLYPYAGNNPFKNIDPSGETPFNASRDIFENLQPISDNIVKGNIGENFAQRILKETFGFEFTALQEKNWNGTQTRMDVPLKNGIGVEVKTTGKVKPSGTLTKAQKAAKAKVPEKYVVMKLSLKSLKWEMKGALNAVGKGFKVFDRVNLFFGFFDNSIGKYINPNNQIIY
jgi:RHS repeat-associated protein